MEPNHALSGRSQTHSRAASQSKKKKRQNTLILSTLPSSHILPVLPIHQICYVVKLRNIIFRNQSPKVLNGAEEVQELPTQNSQHSLLNNEQYVYIQNQPFKCSLYFDKAEQITYIYVKLTEKWYFNTQCELSRKAN